MTLAALLIALLGAGEVSVVVAPGVTCVEQSRLVPRLEAAGLRVLSSPSARLAVTVRLQQQQIVVRATRQGAPFERAMPAQVDECDAIERVLAALIVSWSQQLPAMEPKPQLSPVRKEPEPVLPSPDPPAEVAPLVEAPKDVEPPLPVPVRAPMSVPRAEPVVLVTPLATPPAPVGWPFTLDVAVLGGGSLGPSPAVSGVGQLQLGASLGRMGVLLEGGLETIRSATAPASSSRVESSRQWLSLSGRVRFAPAERLSLDFALGFRAWRITAQSFNALDPKSLELLGLGGVLSAGGSLALAGPLFLHLRAFTSVRTPRLQFSIDGVGPVLSLDPWEGGLLLGLEFRVFGG